MNANTDVKSESLVIRAARVLYHRGDDGGAPINRNGVGFNKPDYAAVRRILLEIEATGATSATQEWALGRILAKYRRQLDEVGLPLDNLGTVATEQWTALRGDEPVTPATRPEPSGHGDVIPRDVAPGWEDAAAALDGHANEPPIVLPSMETILGPDGVIASKLPGYESRTGQITLAQAIADGIVARRHVLGEAGTGVGKSLSYLVPAIYSGQKVIVSTEGKALQDQLAKKDLPFLAAVVAHPFRFAVLKGLSNYACLAKIAEERGDEKIVGATYEWTRYGKDLEAWLAATATGDLAELPFVAPPEFRARLATTSDECEGKDCPFFRDCWAMRARQRAKDADIVVVNHTLLALDVALRDRTSDGVAVLPDRKLIIVDEAHALEEVATDAFTTEVTNWTVPRLLRGKLPGLAGLDPDDLKATNDASDRFWRHFACTDCEGRGARVVTPTNDLELLALEVQTHLRALAKTTRKASEDTGDERTANRLANYADRLRDTADRFVDILTAGEEHVLCLERSAGAKVTTLTLKRAPISVAEDLERALWSKWPVVATSATLTTQGTFAYFRERTGATGGQEAQVGSPFDYPRNALLYLPRDGGAFDPSRSYQDGSVAYFDRLAGEIEALLLASDGRAFCLFTSRRALDEVYRRIGTRLRWTVLRQGEMGTQALVQHFKDDGHAVLFGLRSFMTGVDVQGDALSLVTIDKLPFAAPDDPVYQARCDALTRDTGDRWAWFKRLAIPTATILLKQATGRLIRSKTDRGVCAILDGRLVTKGYGTGIVRSLPPMAQTRSLDAVRAFFAGTASRALDDAMTQQASF